MVSFAGTSVRALLGLNVWHPLTWFPVSSCPQRVEIWEPCSETIWSRKVHKNLRFNPQLHHRSSWPQPRGRSDFRLPQLMGTRKVRQFLIPWPYSPINSTSVSSSRTYSMKPVETDSNQSLHTDMYSLKDLKTLVYSLITLERWHQAPHSFNYIRTWLLHLLR